MILSERAVLVGFGVGFLFVLLFGIFLRGNRRKSMACERTELGSV